ncbi:MAG: hypothetical protein ACD_75C00170G0004 [uncultured bacterium]|nr:MAG: hypothetical protein ACD_75C00170G0004 [uncultured bacterium]
MKRLRVFPRESFLDYPLFFCDNEIILNRPILVLHSYSSVTRHRRRQSLQGIDYYELAGFLHGHSWPVGLGWSGDSRWPGNNHHSAPGQDRRTKKVGAGNGAGASPDGCHSRVHPRWLYLLRPGFSLHLYEQRGGKDAGAESGNAPGPQLLGGFSGYGRYRGRAVFSAGDGERNRR